MKLSSGYDDLAPRTEMVPLMDCVFLVLVFFVYAMLTMVVHRGVSVDLPSAGGAQTDHRAHITVSIRSDNTLAVEGEPVTMAQLVAVVKPLTESSQRVVCIDGDRRSNYGVAIGVMDRLQTAGIKTALLSTRKEADGSP